MQVSHHCKHVRAERQAFPNCPLILHCAERTGSAPVGYRQLYKIGTINKGQAVNVKTVVSHLEDTLRLLALFRTSQGHVCLHLENMGKCVLCLDTLPGNLSYLIEYYLTLVTLFPKE